MPIQPAGFVGGWGKTVGLANHSVLKAATIILLAFVLCSCSLARWRHTFELQADEEAILVHVWMRADSGGAWLVLGDTLLFPLDWLASSLWAARAAIDPDLAVAGGAAGWVFSFLPCVTTVPPSWDAWRPTALDWPNRGGRPEKFSVDSDHLLSVAQAEDGDELRLAVCRAVAWSLAADAGAPDAGSETTPRPVTHALWVDYYQDLVTVVTRVER